MDFEGVKQYRDEEFAGIMGRPFCSYVGDYGFRCWKKALPDSDYCGYHSFAE